MEKSRIACENSKVSPQDHFIDVTDMIEVGKGAQREVKSTLLSRYACYLIVQNADPRKEIVAHGQSYFALQTRRQELADERLEEQRRLLLRRENIQGRTAANRTHHEVGAKVRQTIQELEGIMPEELPAAESIKKAENKQAKLATHAKNTSGEES